MDNRVYFSLFDLEKQIREKNHARFDVYIVSTVLAKVNIMISDIKDFFGDLAKRSYTGYIGKIEVFDPIKQDQIRGVYPGLGSDRVAKIIGAQRLFPDHSILLFDFGTASTCSIAANGFFLGGFISIGFKASLKALNNQCDALDDLSEDKALEDLLRDFDSMKYDSSTPAAIIQGSYAAHIGLIKEWQYLAKKMLDEFFLQNKLCQLPLKTICTGGQSRFFNKFFDEDIAGGKLLTSCFCYQNSVVSS